MQQERANYLFSNKDLSHLILPLLVDAINVLLINIFTALATGGAVVAGQYIGQKRLDKACKAGEQLVLFSTVFAMGVMLIVYLGKSFILQVVFGRIEPDVMNYANTVSNTITAFEILPGKSIGFALVTVVSQCVGAGDYEHLSFV